MHVRDCLHERGKYLLGAAFKDMHTAGCANTLPNTHTNESSTLSHIFVTFSGKDLDLIHLYYKTTSSNSNHSSNPNPPESIPSLFILSNVLDKTS